MSRPESPPLTRRRVLNAARDVVEREGLEGLTMRKVASSVGCKVMSLYRHIEDKDDLLDALIDEVYVELSAPLSDGPWRPTLRTMAIDERGALVRHPWVCGLLATRFPGPARRQHMDALLRVLATADLPEHVADLGYHALTVHIHGFALQETGFQRAADDMAQGLRRYFDGSPEDETPHLTAHFRYHAEHGHESDDFTFVLDLILEGLERAATK